MHKMADDILALRSQVSALESENSRLSLHQDLGHSQLDDTDTDVMTKSEMADRIGIIPPTIISLKHIKISQGIVNLITANTAISSARLVNFYHHQYYLAGNQSFFYICIIIPDFYHNIIILTWFIRCLHFQILPPASFLLKLKTYSEY